jgi:hypothetical protein
MSKTIAFKMPAPTVGAADDWIAKGVEPHLKPMPVESLPSKPIPAAPVPMKRLTLDISEEMHTRFKLGSMQRNQTMLEIIRAFIDAEFPAKS